MKNKPKVESGVPEAKKCVESVAEPKEVRVFVENATQKPEVRNPRWWDVLGWLLRFVLALAALLKLFKDK